MRELAAAIAEHGHRVELLRLPFKFFPEQEIERMMDYYEGYDLNGHNGRSVDRVVSLQFPGYGIAHKEHVVWLMHQHRAVYELYGRFTKPTEELTQLREKVHAYDSRVLAKAKKLFANSGRVAERLNEFNGLSAEPLYHPPPDAEALYSGDCLDYVFYPSRLEFLKRQDLLIEAACHLKTPVKLILSGGGSHQAGFQALIDKYDLQERVRLVGHCSDAEKRAWYANALAVYFGPYDEDYGYVTLEAMLSSRPLITCNDSGGPREFVEDGETGLVVDPEPQAIAAAIDKLYSDKRKARQMGEAGREKFDQLNITWANVVERLLG